MKPFILILLSFIILGCSTTKELRMPSSLELTEAVISRGIDVIDSSTAIPLNHGFAFSTEDKEVAAYIKFKNFFRERRIRWDWFDPSNNLYHSTNDVILKPSDNNHKGVVSTWNSLAINGTRVTDFPGEWRVDVYLDNIVVFSTTFRIDKHIETIPDSAGIPDPRKWGLIIGIEKYPDLKSVDYAENDARLAKGYFQKVIGIPEDNIITLAGNDAVRPKIMDYLKNYFPKKVHKDSILYVYYAGHGFPFPKEEGTEPYLVLYDSRITTISDTGYRLRDFYDDINKLEIKNAFIFFDTSFNGTASQGNAPISEKTISITSSSRGETSSAFSEKRHGLFTFFLLSGIGGKADTDKNNSISIGELYEYVRMNVSMVSRRKGMIQTPEIIPSLNKIKDIEVTSKN